jgi:glycosyltransferase involved in cell wall biosynthesis
MMYSVVIPAYNEAENLELFVSRFIDRLAAEISDLRFEVLIVENGSTDETLVCANRLGDTYPGIVSVFSNERGSYGEAIKRGMLESKGTYLSILECDYLDVDFVVRSIALLERGKARFIVASKAHPDSVDRRPFKRRALTRIFNLILRWTLSYPGTDTHGLKSMETALAKTLCREAITTDEIFQTEIVLMAWRSGEKIVELPTCIEELRPATVSVIRRLPKVLDLIRQLRRSLRRFPPQPAGSRAAGQSDIGLSVSCRAGKRPKPKVV